VWKAVHSTLHRCGAVLCATTSTTTITPVYISHEWFAVLCCDASQPATPCTSAWQPRCQRAPCILSLQAILGGKVEPPASFKPLYDALAAHLVGAGTHVLSV
jgi:hypothetical protein